MGHLTRNDPLLEQSASSPFKKGLSGFTGLKSRFGILAFIPCQFSIKNWQIGTVSSQHASMLCMNCLIAILNPALAFNH